MKVLRVCSKDELPTLLERDPNYIYFVYDVLELYLGQNIYTDPYLVCDNDPIEPIEGMMYFILANGNVKMYSDYTLKTIAEIESPEMLDLLLKQGGSYFFVNADKRYLDVQNRMITLPYRNGQWDLTVDAANNIQLTEDTAIGFNPETNSFDISATRYDYDLVFTHDYRGLESPTAATTVEENSIKTDVKVSGVYGNIIKVVNDGLSAVISGKVERDEFESWRTEFYDYKANMDALMAELEEKVGHLDEDISEEAISRKVHQALLEVYPLIDQSLVQYDELIRQINTIESRAKAYTDVVFADALNEIRDAIDHTDYWGPISP